MFTLDKERIEDKIHSIGSNHSINIRKKIIGKRTYFLIDKQFVDLINYYYENSDVGFKGMKAIIVRRAIRQYREYLNSLRSVGTNIKDINFSKIQGNSLKKISTWHMLISSAGTRKRLSSENKRLSMNIKVEKELSDFLRMLAIEYNQADPFKTPPLITRKQAHKQGMQISNYQYMLGKDVKKKFKRKPRRSHSEPIDKHRRILYRRGRRVNVIPNPDAPYINYEGSSWGYASFIANEALYFFFSERIMYLG